MMLTLKTPEQIECDLREAAQMVRDRARAIGDYRAANASIEDIVECLKQWRREDPDIAGPQSLN